MVLDEKLKSILKLYESGLYSLQEIYEDNELEFLAIRISRDKLYLFLLDNKDMLSDFLIFNELYPYDKKLLYIKNIELTYVQHKRRSEFLIDLISNLESDSNSLIEIYTENKSALLNVNIKDFEEFEYQIFKLDEYPKDFKFVKTSFGNSVLTIIDTQNNVEEESIESAQEEVIHTDENQSNAQGISANEDIIEHKTVDAFEEVIETTENDLVQPSEAEEVLYEIEKGLSNQEPVEVEDTSKNINIDEKNKVEIKQLKNFEQKKLLFKILDGMAFGSYSLDYLRKKYKNKLENIGIKTTSQLEKALVELESYSKFFELHSVESKYYDFIKIGDNKSRIYKLSVIEEILINLKDGVYTLDNIYYDYYELLELNGINSKALFKNLIEELPENDKFKLKKSGNNSISIVTEMNNADLEIREFSSKKLEDNNKEHNDDLNFNDEQSGNINEQKSNIADKKINISLNEKEKKWLYSVLDNLNPGRISLKMLFDRHYNYLSRIGITSIDEFVNTILSLDSLPKFVKIDKTNISGERERYYIDVNRKRSKTYRYNVLNDIFNRLEKGSYSLDKLYNNHKEYLNEHGIENKETLKKLLRGYHNNERISYYEITDNYSYVQINKQQNETLKPIDFKKNIYKVDEMKLIFEDNELDFTKVNLNKYGFEIDSDIVYCSDEYDDIDTAFKDYLSDKRTIKIKDNQLLNTLSAQNFIRKSIKNFDLLYYNSDFLINNFIPSDAMNKEKIREFINFVKNIEDLDYFTVKVLLKKYNNPLLNLRYPEKFYEQILVHSNEFYIVNRISPYLFYKGSDDKVTLSDFYMDQVLNYERSVEVYKFMDDIKRRTGFEVDRYNLIRELVNQDLFYSPEMQKIYFYSEDYYREVYG